MVISKTAGKNVYFYKKKDVRKKNKTNLLAGQLDAATFAKCRNTNRSLLEWQGPAWP